MRTAVGVVAERTARLFGRSSRARGFLKPNAFVAAAHVHPSRRFQVLRGGPLSARPQESPRRPRPADHGSRRDQRTRLERGRGRGALQYMQKSAGDAVRAADRDDVRARRRGKTNRKGMPNPLHLAVIASITSTTCVFPSRLHGCGGRARARRPRVGCSATRRPSPPRARLRSRRRSRRRRECRGKLDQAVLDSAAACALRRRRRPDRAGRGGSPWPPSACSRSAQISLASSSPTLRRTRFSGTRSPSQRPGLGTERVPPRLVAFLIARTDRSTRCAAGSTGDVEAQQPAEAWIADALDGSVRLEPSRDLGSRSPAAHPGSSVSRLRRRSQAASGAATIPERLRNCRSCS